ncbi:MAG: hypothetical protein V2I82_00165 [Halieaceae bacterium]|jgi:hypothetical protein|nr:hypothetical protein [Halieaceae bacterium]
MSLGDDAKNAVHNKMKELEAQIEADRAEAEREAAEAENDKASAEIREKAQKKLQGLIDDVKDLKRQLDAA